MGRGIVGLALVLTGLMVATAFVNGFSAPFGNRIESAGGLLDGTGANGPNGPGAHETGPPQVSPTDSVLQPAFGTCPGAPGEGRLERRPDTAKGADGTLHMVWSERFGGQFDVCYANNAGGNEMGLGSDANLASRITRTPSDSVAPHLIIDAETGIVYVFWADLLPPEEDDGVFSALDVTTGIFYVATPDAQDWSAPIFFGSCDRGIEKGGDPSTSEALRCLSDTLALAAKGLKDKADATRALLGSLQTDGDELPDRVEALGINGVVTFWWDPDTDKDGLYDHLEFRYGFDPLFNDLLGNRIKEFLDLILLVGDDDGDGLTNGQEFGCGFPVTNGFANVLSGGGITYRFWPRTAYTADLLALLEVRRQGIGSIPPPEMASLTVNVTVTSSSPTTFSFTASALEGDRVSYDLGSFPVAVDDQTDVRIDVAVSQPPSNGFRTLGVHTVMIASPTTSTDFSYKEGRDYLPGDASLAAALVENFEVCGDYTRPDLFLEVDAIATHNPTPDVFSESINAYSDAGIILHYRLDETTISLSEPTTTDTDGDGATTLNRCVDENEIRDFLAAHRNLATPYEEYMHVIFAHDVKSNTSSGCQALFGRANSAALATDPTHSGVLIGDNQLDSSISTATVTQQRVKVLIHEVGHALGASHEGPLGGTPAGTWSATSWRAPRRTTVTKSMTACRRQPTRSRGI